MAGDPSKATSAALIQMTLVQSVVFRLIGLYIFLAPKRGAKFLADVVVRTNREVAAKQREKEGRSLAA